ncbi:MAG: FAD-dependent monooxygenase [Synechococcaceae cyanobacterium]
MPPAIHTPSHDSHQDQPPVLIVGGGPSGLFCAGELARRGVRSRLIEQAPAPHRQTRATVLQSATQELFCSAALWDAFAAVAQPIRRRQLQLDDGRVLEERVDAVDSPFPAQLSLPQWRTEALLAERLEQLGGRIERGVALQRVEEEGEGLRLELEHGDGLRETLRVRYLIDASGSHSLTRASMREELEGETYAGHYLVADLVLRQPPEAMAQADDLTWLRISPLGLVLLSPLPEGRTLMFIGGLDADREGQAYDVDSIGALLAARCGRDHGPADLRWSSGFRMHRRLAPRLADGRRFLLGDAGHLSSPLGGEGMNSGLLDAADLAWKLALVLQGAAPESLLQSYGIERGLVDRQVLRFSDQQHRLVAGLVAAAAAGEEPNLPPADPAAERAQQRARAMLDHSLAGSPLIGGFLGDGLEAVALPAPAPGERWPDRCRLDLSVPCLLVWGTPPAALEAWAERWASRVVWHSFQDLGFDPERAGLPVSAPSGAVLIRPDGFVAFRALPFCNAAVAALERHLQGWLLPASAHA